MVNTNQIRNTNEQRAIIAAVIFVGIGLLAAPTAFAQQVNNNINLTVEQQTEQTAIIETQNLSTGTIRDQQQANGGFFFASRWAGVEWIAPDSTAILIADCLPGESAVSAQYITNSEDLHILQSFAVATDAKYASWIIAVQNTDEEEAHSIGLGVLCFSTDGIEKVGTVGSIDVIEISNSIDINNVIKNVINNNNTVIVNNPPPNTGNNTTTPPPTNEEPPTTGNETETEVPTPPPVDETEQEEETTTTPPTEEETEVIPPTEEEENTETTEPEETETETPTTEPEETEVTESETEEQEETNTESDTVGA